MKSLISLLFLFFLSANSMVAQWVKQDSPTQESFHNLYFLDQNRGWICGYNGTILKTVDGGKKWISKNIGTLDHVHAIFFADSLNGWAVLYGYAPFRHGSIINTTDGGDSWNVQFSILDYTLHSIYFTDSNNGWAAGSNGIVYHTTNAGNQWSQQYPETEGGWLWPIFFIDNNVGWTVGDPLFGIFKTTDGGETWQSYSIPVVERVHSVVFLDSVTGWLCGAQGQIAKSINGGANWEIIYSDVSEYFRDIFFYDLNIGWCVGENGTILYTENGGINWSPQNSGTSNELRAVQFIDDTTGWAVGLNGTILKTTSSSFVTVNSPNGGEEWLSNSEYNITWSSNKIDSLKIEYTTNNGESWINIVSSIPAVAGVYLWVVPNTESDQCRVRISDLYDSTNYDISNNVFIISSTINPMITVISPNGGESLIANTQYEITWNSSSILDVKIELSVNNGASWSTIVHFTPSTGIYNWLVPSIPSLQSLIKISDVSNSNVSDQSDLVFTINDLTGVDEYNSPVSYALFDNYPNPFNPHTKIKYQIPERNFVSIKIYDVLGNEIATLVDEEKTAGKYEEIWNTKNLPSGIYLYKLRAGNFIETKKMVLMK